MGVIVGVVGTLLTSHLSGKAQWARAHCVRWDERRLDAYAEGSCHAVIGVNGAVHRWRQ